MQEQGFAQGTSGNGDRVRCGRNVAALPQHLAADLEQLIDDGYTVAEPAVEALHCVLAGKLVERQMDRVGAIFARYADRLAYSVHSPAVLDLRDRRDPDLHREILLSCVRFAGTIGARVLVVHYEARSDDEAVEAQYRRAIEAAAEEAGRLGVILGIENIEVERTERVLEFLEAVRHPWVRMTYDFAHDYLASDLFGYDHLASARACAPYAAHLHLTDNYGRFNPARLGDFLQYRATPYTYITVTGLGDMHLPLGWGTLPAAKVFASFADLGYRGALISEHERRVFTDQDAAVCRDMQALIQG
jgi:sugar phosphate isomerase/epimerase